MTRDRATRPLIAAALAALMIIEPPLAATAQASIWTERRQAAPAPTLASLPMTGPARSILSALPAARRPMAVLPAVGAASPLLPLMAALPAEHVQVRSVQGGAGKP